MADKKEAEVVIPYMEAAPFPAPGEIKPTAIEVPAEEEVENE